MVLPWERDSTSRHCNPELMRQAITGQCQQKRFLILCLSLDDRFGLTFHLRPASSIP
jgi:hypothetical protein